jgi:hypothetical protein
LRPHAILVEISIGFVVKIVGRFSEWLSPSYLYSRCRDMAISQEERAQWSFTK